MNGLSSAQASELLKKYGLNELRGKKQVSGLKIFLSQFTSPLIYVLVFAGLVTLFLKDFTDSLVIFAAVAINTALGFYQEFKAQKTLQALKILLAPKAKVIRDGRQQIIDARLLVPGDLVVLTIGDRVPADGVLVEATDLTVNEAILTGESGAVKKSKIQKPASRDSFGIPKSKINPKFQIQNSKKENSVFAGTIVVTGIGKMVVTKTGMETEMGKIGKVVEEVGEEKTPLQIELGKLAKILAALVGIITLGIFVLGKIRGYPALQMFTTSVAVAVAAIPEGLVVTLTVILALGMQRILRQKAIVRRLLAAETLGSVTVICADKTGTLTEGKMRVVKAVVNEEQPEAEEWLVKAAVLCNDMRDPLEEAMMKWAEENLKFLPAGRQGKIENLKSDYPRVDEVPFSPKTKIIATLHQISNIKYKISNIIFVSGAPEIVLEKSKIQSTKSKIKWLEKFEEYGKKGYRLVGFGYKKIENWKLPACRTGRKIENSDLKNLEWLGILVYEDSPRKGVKEALEECQKAGIKVKVITGDYLPTALALLAKLGLDGKKHSLTGEELEKISEEELRQRVDENVLFARTDPQQKLKIVKALRQNGEVVAMMGDGVNDAPALKQADIGIVVSEASDVARETADMVLLDSNFATIVHAVEEGRNIFENVKKVCLFLLSDSFMEVILIGGAILLGLPLPVTAAQILWVNLIEDSLPAIALAFEPKERRLMSQPPRPKNAPILDSELKFLIFIIGISLNIFLLALFYWLTRGWLHLHHIQTVMFVALGIDTMFVTYSCRSLRQTIFQYNPFANKVLNGAIFFGFLLLLAGVYLPGLQKLLGTHPLGWEEWAFILALGIISLLAIEGGKLVFIKNDKIK